MYLSIRPASKQPYSQNNAIDVYSKWYLRQGQWWAWVLTDIVCAQKNSRFCKCYSRASLMCSMPLHDKYVYSIRTLLLAVLIMDFFKPKSNGNSARVLLEEIRVWPVERQLMKQQQLLK
jgi:hypothetical protein